MPSRIDSHDSVPVRVARALEAATAQRRPQSADEGRTEQPHKPDARQSGPRHIAGIAIAKVTAIGDSEIVMVDAGPSQTSRRAVCRRF
jgi:hypothetical protein